MRYTPEEEAAIRQNAKMWAVSALTFGPTEQQSIAAFIDKTQISDTGRPYCGACESMLCNACGQCHSYDTNWEIGGRFCPLHEEYDGWPCVAAYQAVNALWQARREAGEDI